jgi:hypothetical protein
MWRKEVSQKHWYFLADYATRIHVFTYHSCQKLAHLVLFFKKFCVLKCEEEKYTYRYKVRVSENMMLRRAFGLKREEVTRGRRKMHNEQLCGL